MNAVQPLTLDQIAQQELFQAIHNIVVAALQMPEYQDVNAEGLAWLIQSNLSVYEGSQYSVVLEFLRHMKP